MSIQYQIPGLETPAKVTRVDTKRKGYEWKREVRGYLATHGIKTESREIGAAGDDLWNEWLSVECKNQRQMDLAGFVDQCRRNAYDKLPVVMIHRPGRGSAGQGYAVLAIEDFVRLIEAKVRP